MMNSEKAIKIAINAVGGQGGGVLAGWIVKAGEKAGFIAQSTSVPGVAQRTGATVYYIELFPKDLAEKKGKPPVLALTAIPGDVDVVLASELMEAGRALTRGFVTGQTTLIASSHRDYAISEKSAMSDGRKSADSIIKAAERTAGRFVYADMEKAAGEAGAVISAVLFGALAGSAALPIAREIFEEVIRDGGRAVERNLAGFAKGFDAARAAAPPQKAVEKSKAQRGEAAPAVRPLLERLESAFPPPAHALLAEGLKKVVDFQDPKYGALYLDRLEPIHELDAACDGGRRNWRLLQTVGKHLALWMAYEDAIRVADLKTRASRFQRFREDVRAEPDQIVHVSEYLHPRVEEVCDLLPAGMARAVLSSQKMRKALDFVVNKDRRVSTTKLRGFLVLYGLASLRPWRRATSRYAIEQARMESWLFLIHAEAKTDYDLACEIAALQRLIKGYGDTHARGLANFERIVAQMGAVKSQPDPTKALRRLHEAALADEEGKALDAAVRKLEPAPAVAA